LLKEITDINIDWATHVTHVYGTLLKIITVQGYLKTRIYAMGAVIRDRKCKKLRDSQENIAVILHKIFFFHL
jgi:hypothetical protein